ncbi:MAG: hypothetical protein R3F43_05875 [bacterium]
MRQPAALACAAARASARLTAPGRPLFFFNELGLLDDLGLVAVGGVRGGLDRLVGGSLRL